MSVSYLEGENQYQDSAKKKHDAKISLHFTKLPSILFIQLKRFDYDIETEAMIKVNKRVEYPEKLNLFHYINDKDSIYSLYGVIVHSGDHKFGHYYCYILCQDDNWRKFNDNRVSKAGIADVLDSNFGGTKKEFRIRENEIVIDEEVNRESAYILFYIRDSQKSKIFIDFQKSNVYIILKNNNRFPTR